MEHSLSQTRKPHLVIEPSSGWVSLNLRELWHFRDLLLTLAARDVKLRYRQTALGPVWVLLGPLLSAGIFSFVFTNLAALPTDGVPGLLFVYIGMMAFSAFSNTLGKTAGSLVGNQHLVSKVYFPRMILPLSVVFSVLIDFLVALCVTAALMLYFRQPVSPAVVLLPFWLGLILLFALGIGLVFAALIVTYRDVGFAIGPLTQFLQFASPVVYPVSLVSGKLGRLLPLYYLNPMASLIQGFRWSLVGGTAPPVAFVVYSVCFTIVLFFAGAYLFGKMERRFADVI